MLRSNSWGCSRPKGKARVLRLVNQARSGDLSIRAACATAYQRFLRSSASDPNEEAEAGSLLESEQAANIHFIAEFLSKQSGA